MSLLPSPSFPAIVTLLSPPSSSVPARGAPTTALSFSTKSPNFLPQRPPIRSRRSDTLRTPRVAAPTTPPTTSDPDKSTEVEEQFGEESSSSKFSWRDHWYPVSLVEDLDPRLPTPFQLLGRDIVIWFDKSSSQWVAFDDKCPHRLAPLSVRRFLVLSFHSVLT